MMKNNLFKILDLKGGVLYNDLGVVDLSIPLDFQKHNLIEDINQITYENCFIDIGWYPEDQEVIKESYFYVRVIQKENWELPIFENKCGSLFKLKKTLEKAISIAIEIT